MVRFFCYEIEYYLNNLINKKNPIEDSLCSDSKISLNLTLYFRWFDLFIGGDSAFKFKHLLWESYKF